MALLVVLGIDPAREMATLRLFHLCWSRLRLWGRSRSGLRGGSGFTWDIIGRC